MSQRPAAVCLLVCEQVIVEDATQNLTPVNSFTRRIVQQFPSEPFGFVVFAILNDGVGEIRLELAISRLDTYETVYQRSMAVRFGHQLQDGRCLFRVRDCSFPSQAHMKSHCCNRLFDRDDFEATIRIFGPDEGGRRTPAYNGIRWDFGYADQADGNDLYMIWPDFSSENGESLSRDIPLPVGVELPARMMVFVDEMRAAVHRNRIKPGVRFFCREGGKRVAEGVVIRVTGLLAHRE